MCCIGVCYLVAESKDQCVVSAVATELALERLDGRALCSDVPPNNAAPAPLEVVVDPAVNLVAQPVNVVDGVVPDRLLALLVGRAADVDNVDQCIGKGR